MEALTVFEGAGIKTGIAGTTLDLGEFYLKKKNYHEAERYFHYSFKVASAIGSKVIIKKNYIRFATIDSIKNDYKGALKNYKMFIVYRDSLINEESTKKTIQVQMQYEFDKKEAAVKAANDKLSAVQTAEKNRQQIILVLVSCVLLLVLIFSGFIFRALGITRKQKQLIEQQKHLVEEKQKEILDSIRYARRIQTALLPTEKYIEKTLMRLMKMSR